MGGVLAWLRARAEAVDAASFTVAHAVSFTVIHDSRNQLKPASFTVTARHSTSPWPVDGD